MAWLDDTIIPEAATQISAEVQQVIDAWIAEHWPELDALGQCSIAIDADETARLAAQIRPTLEAWLRERLDPPVA